MEHIEKGLQHQAWMRERLIASLSERGLLRDDENGSRGPVTIYGQPAWRAIEPGHEPQALMAATARQRDLVAIAHGTAPAPAGQCALWIEEAFARMGLGIVCGNASELYESWCHLTDTADLKVGMIVAVPAHPYSTSGRAWGHVGLYIGDRRIRHCADARVASVPFELWTSNYGVMCAPRWGWLGGIALD